MILQASHFWLEEWRCCCSSHCSTHFTDAGGGAVPYTKIFQKAASTGKEPPDAHKHLSSVASKLIFKIKTLIFMCN